VTKHYFLNYEFDSRPEYERAAYLYSLAQAGIIQDLCMDKALLKVQLCEGGIIPRHALRPAKMPKRGSKMRDLSYTPDFRFSYQGVIIAEDVKGAYGDTKKTRAKKKANKPIVTDVSHVRQRLYQMQNPHIIFRLVTIPTADVDSVDSYYYLF